jgi:hypothetical protein
VQVGAIHVGAIQVGGTVNILVWHVHGSYLTSFVQGEHTCLIPVTPDRGADGLGRARTWDWPERAREIAPEALGNAAVDVVVLQRPHEFDLARRWLGRTPGDDVAAVYLEHTSPAGDVPDTRHPMAGRGIPIVHVTHTNDLMWDCAGSPTHVVEHGVVDPGPRWTGEIDRAAVAVNDPMTRGRTVGTDLLPYFAEAAGLDGFGMRVTDLDRRLGLPPGRLRAYEDLPQERMHDELARRRVYLHTARWTSLGLSLLEAMHLAMPVVAVAATEVGRAVPPAAGTVSTSRAELRDGLRRLIASPAAAREAGLVAREAALARYGLKRFLDDWNDLLAAAVRQGL